jgi:hypothetical protein
MTLCHSTTFTAGHCHYQLSIAGVAEGIEVAVEDEEDEVAVVTAVSAVYEGATASDIRVLGTRIVPIMKNPDPLGLVLTADSDFLVRAHSSERPLGKLQLRLLPRLSLDVKDLTLTLW